MKNNGSQICDWLVIPSILGFHRQACTCARFACMGNVTQIYDALAGLRAVDLEPNTGRCVRVCVRV
jgi:hypothetical protein